jgi:hypothetical protein
MTSDQGQSDKAIGETVKPDLRQRIKAARGPDRHLDRAIFGFVTGRPARWWTRGIPPYTGSFEAALTLLPKLVYVEVSGGTDTGQDGVWPAVSIRWLRPGETNLKKWQGTVKGAPSFALAMCRAAIDVRVRMAEHQP